MNILTLLLLLVAAVFSILALISNSVKYAAIAVFALTLVLALGQNWKG